jgi:hypothetical protein
MKITIKPNTHKGWSIEWREDHENRNNWMAKKGAAMLFADTPTLLIRKIDENEVENGGDEPSRKKKRIRAGQGKGEGEEEGKEMTNQSKKPKIQKPPKKPKEPKTSKPPNSEKTKKLKVNDLISQTTKKLKSKDIFTTDETIGSSSFNPIPAVFNVTGVDANLLELREALKRFRDSAVGTSFSPGKFPSALRPKLNETICAMLRCTRPSLQSPLPSRFFPSLASFLPFSPAALNKLLSRKILGPLIESIEKNEIPKLYDTWERSILNRIKEDGSIIIINTPVIIEEPTTTTTTTTNNNNTQKDNNSTSPNSNNQPLQLKKKLKFNDEMRQIIFEILRTEIDLNNLIILSNTLEASAVAVSSSSNPSLS